jgi:glycine C-acetyltransferase
MALHIKVKEHFLREMEELRNADLFKEERFIHSPQAARINVEYPAASPLREVVNFCANNYLGLSSHPEVIKAAHAGLDARGYGMSSVRFICGTQDAHKQLERNISAFLGMEDAILYSSCFDANLGVFETLLSEEDALISDELNHASIIDGIRLCKAERRRYKHMDLHELERHLKETMEKRFRLIVTDGVFSMDGDLAPLEQICNLAEEYEAMVLVDDSHATGFIGRTGRGTHEHFDVMGRVDIITTTFGKALEMLRSSTALRDTLEQNTMYFRKNMAGAGFDIRPGIHPIVPIILHEAELVQAMSRQLYDEGVYVIGFFYPVVPRGRARIRVQISAAHTREHLDQAIAAFTKVGKKLGVLK